MILGAEIASAVERQARLAGGPEVRRASEQPRHVLGEDVQHLARGIPGRHPLGVGGERRQAAGPSVRQLATYHAVAVFREFWVLATVLLEFGPPCRLQRPPTRADAGLEMLAHALGHAERGVFRPAV